MKFENAIVAELPKLRKYAFRLTGGGSIDADDLVQDVMLMALRKQHLYVESDLRGWLFTIMHNCYVTGVRQSARRATVSLNDDIPSYTNADAGILVREVVEEIERLPPRRRRIIEHFVYGATYDEVAHRERVPVGTVRSRLSRTREKLREFAS